MDGAKAVRVLRIRCEMLVVPVDVPADGTYSVEVGAWLGYQSDDAAGRPGTLTSPRS